MEQFLRPGNIMKKIPVIILFLVSWAGVHAQTVTPVPADSPMVRINKDPRLDILGKVESEFNSMAARFAKGYRLLVLKSDNRDYSMKVRAYLLQTFPDQKVIMTYQAPFIKLKFGNFTEKEEAERYRDMIMKGRIVTGNVYLVAETVEVKPDKNKEEEMQ